jgi:peptidoglycan/xylan/chitin deacetylase (PgdA/CDA1 family)
VNDRRRVALTFDAEHPDRPNAPTDAPVRILDALAEAGVRATFFVQSRWAMANPELARRIANDGHLVGNHSTYHARLTLLSDEGVREDASGAGTTIADLTGTDPRPWFRCPFGDGHDDPRILECLSSLGYRNVHWHVECQDWEPWRSGREIARDVSIAVAAHGDGAVVLLHTWPGGTADAVSRVLADLASAGVSFVTVDELEDLP